MFLQLSHFNTVTLFHPEETAVTSLVQITLFTITKEELQRQLSNSTLIHAQFLHRRTTYILQNL